MAFEERLEREGRSGLIKVKNVGKYLRQKRIWLIHGTKEGQRSRAQTGRRSMRQGESGEAARSDPAGLSSQDKMFTSYQNCNGR